MYLDLYEIRNVCHLHRARGHAPGTSSRRYLTVLPVGPEQKADHVSQR